MFSLRGWRSWLYTSRWSRTEPKVDSQHDYSLLRDADRAATTLNIESGNIRNRRIVDQDEAHELNDAAQPQSTAFGEPTEEDFNTLRRVSGRIPWQAYSVTFVEFCERFSYYGTTAVFVNFIQQPLPPFSTTGSITQTAECYSLYSQAVCEQPGALGRGQSASSGLVTFNVFWAYILPLAGGYVADSYWGRYKTIQASVVCALAGHTLLIISALPVLIQRPQLAFASFVIGLLILGLGTGGFKANISPLLGEQLGDIRPHVVTLPTEERVIKDPQLTVSRVFLYFYLGINVGSFSAGVSMVYAERYIGFWLAYALPTLLFWLAPIVLICCKPMYTLSPPTGSVTSKSFRLLMLASKGAWSANPLLCYRQFNRPDFWHSVKPSVLGPSAPSWMSQIDDAWVDQVGRGFSACKVLAWMPLYWLSYSQMAANMTSQSAVLQLGNVPNDLINSINPLTLIVLIPFTDALVYPALRRAGFKTTPLRRIAMGFALAGAAMLAACAVQLRVYATSPCAPVDVATSADCHAPLSVWAQAPSYCLIALSEIFASVTTLEYAFTKAPTNMRGLVMGINLLQASLGAALAQLLLPLSRDPWLAWNYGLIGTLSLLGGVGFWITWRDLDAREDELNALPPSTFAGRVRPAVSLGSSARVGIEDDDDGDSEL